jgi:hypothetical protein
MTSMLSNLSQNVISISVYTVSLVTMTDDYEYGKKSGITSRDLMEILFRHLRVGLKKPIKSVSQPAGLPRFEPGTS